MVAMATYTLIVKFRLRLKAVSKVRSFLLAQISALRKPKTNLTILQNNVLLKYKDCVAFLRNNAPAVFNEVKHTYTDTISQV